MPEVIVIDEIGTELEAVAARTIAERGVQLIGTAHGNNLDNLMLNPTLSDLIGGIQTVTLGDDEARRRRTQKSVLERKAPPTFDVVVEIADRDRVAVHADVAETVDALLRGDALAPEVRWRDEGGVHRSQARPRPGPRTRLPGERFGGLVGAGLGGWPLEPGWHPDARRELVAHGDAGGGRTGGVSRRRSRARGRGASQMATVGWPGDAPARRIEDAAVFRAGAMADRGPLERGTPAPEPRARDSREYERQAEWRAAAGRAMTDVLLQGTDVGEADGAPLVVDGAPSASLGEWPGTAEGPFLGSAPDDDADFAERFVDEEASLIRLTERHEGTMTLQPMTVLGYGVSRKRLEQAIKDLQLPIVVVREPDEADLVITLRNTYKQRSPIIREAEARGLPIYVLKTNTVVQMQSILTSLYALDTDPQQLALRELEEAIGLVRSEAKPVELSPQNAFVRKLQHRAAEAANLVSRSRGREPFRRVRVYPEKARAWR
jgi:hypothetical protein